MPRMAELSPSINTVSLSLSSSIGSIKIGEASNAPLSSLRPYDIPPFVFTEVNSVLVVYHRNHLHYYTISFSEYSARWALSSIGASSLSISFSTMRLVNFSIVVLLGFHLSFVFALVGAPHRLTTSVG